MNDAGIRAHVPETEPFRWEGVPVLAYKEPGSHFQDVTRQVLFDGEGIGAELRYFEVAAGGWSTLERHQHVHAVLIVRGEGKALIGDRIVELAPHDLVRVSSLTWHQFRAAPNAPLGFLCLVPCGRDRPERPDAGALAALRRDPTVADFIRA